MVENIVLGRNVDIISLRWLRSLWTKLYYLSGLIVILNSSILIQENIVLVMTDKEDGNQ